jgi:TonB-linked SusC/RagA family outer membrane protein
LVSFGVCKTPVHYPKTARDKTGGDVAHGCIFVCVQASAQSVSLSAKNMALKKVFSEIKKQTNYTVFSRKEFFHDAKPVTVSVQQMPLVDFLDLVMKDQPLQYRINAKEIILSRKTVTAAVPQQEVPANNTPVSSDPVTVTGRVYDAEGLPLAGASISIRNSGATSLSSTDGQFSIKALTGNLMTVSYVGQTPQEIVIKDGRTLSVRMKPLEDQMGGVVVTGIFNRRSESFTGSSTKVTRQELMRNGAMNIFQSLANIDPSLNIYENLSTGSNPNKMPDMQIRGTASFPDIKGQYTTNPNQPLFIVDGFEMTIEKVNDLNINRVESVTILKDASAKALYGSRAANGVIVIETVKVKPGELRVNYTGTFGFEMPDFSSYNLTNATEKLELERQLGAYNRAQPIVDLVYDSLYYSNLKQVQNGVNTDWLAQPVRMGFSHKQTVGFEAGDERLRTGLTFFTGNTAGVMNGSDRKNIGGAFSIIFHYKKLLFRNLLQYTGVKAANSPYGDFSEYSRLNPYWRKTNNDGSVRKFLGIGPVYSESVYNPLYNATLNTASTSEYTDVTNNTYFEWMASRNLKVMARIGFSNTISGSEVFYPGSHTKFIGYTGDNLFLRGSYDKGNGKTSMVNADVNVNYSKTWGKGILFTNLGANIREDNAESYLYSAIGFPNDRMDNIIFAKQYQLNGKPSGSEYISRELGALAVANYSYDNRYFADLSLRTSASSQFGSDNRWGSFWAAGIGWNLHRESFFKNLKAVDLLKIRGSMGYTGSQNFNSYQAMLLYNYFVDNSYQGQLGTYLNGLSNPNLKWQQKLGL